MKKGVKRKTSKKNSVRTLNKKEIFFVFGLVLLVSIFANVILSKEYLQQAPAISSVRSAGIQTGISPVKKSIPQLAGWPRQFNGVMISPSTVEDIDNDGILELIVFESTNNALIHVLDSQGNNKAGWPLVPLGNALGGHLSLGDVTGDGYMEIVGIANEKIFIYDYFGNLLSGWPRDITTFASVHSPTLADLNNDGIKEIIFSGGSLPPNNIASLYTYNSQGNLLQGFPATLRGDSYSEVAVADINLDGQKEIIVTSNFKSDPYQYNIDDIYLEVFDHSGIKIWENQFPYGIPTPQLVPASIGNLDHDPELEIVFPSYEGNIHAFNHDGSQLQSWPQFLDTNNSWKSPAAIGDIDNDGIHEVIYFSTSGTLFVLEDSGSIKWSKSYSSGLGGGFISASPIIADIDGDGRMEVLISTNGGPNPGIYAFNGEDGSLVPRFPLHGDSGLNSFRRSSPLVIDFDLDGDIEIIAGGDDGKIYVWDLDSPYNSNLVYWETLQQNSQRTGVAI
jgi:hypothetical protein